MLTVDDIMKGGSYGTMDRATLPFVAEETRLSRSLVLEVYRVIRLVESKNIVGSNWIPSVQYHFDDRVCAGNFFDIELIDGTRFYTVPFRKLQNWGRIARYRVIEFRTPDKYPYVPTPDDTDDFFIMQSNLNAD